MRRIQFVDQLLSMIHRVASDRERCKLRMFAFVKLGGNVVFCLSFLTVVEILVQIYDYFVVQIDTVWIERKNISGRSFPGLKDRCNIPSACDCCVQLPGLLCEGMRFAEKLQSYNQENRKKQYIQ